MAENLPGTLRIEAVQQIKPGRSTGSLEDKEIYKLV